MKKIKPLPHIKPGYQILLFVVTLIVGGLAIILSGAEQVSIILMIAVDAAAFCLLSLSVYYIIRYFVRDVKEIKKMVVSRYRVVNYLSENYKDRSFIFAVPGFVVNCLFTLFNAFIGVRAFSAWYISLAVYYAMLGIMRFKFLNQELMLRRGDKERSSALREWKVFLHMGILLILMSIALSGMVILMVRGGYGKSYPEYIIYVVALYTFIKLITSIINMVKAGKYKSPQLMGLRNIGYADALVSMLSLQTAMFAAFDNGDMAFRELMNSITGACVCVMVIGIGVSMVCIGALNIKKVNVKE